MKNKTPATISNYIFASSAIQAQVSVGVNIGLPTVIISDIMSVDYEPQEEQQNINKIVSL
jgi:hypothetical protein